MKDGVALYSGKTFPILLSKSLSVGVSIRTTHHFVSKFENIWHELLVPSGIDAFLCIDGNLKRYYE